MDAKPSPTLAPQIVVLGSLNMDLVARMERLPRAGETVSGQTFETIAGGKGANQAVAAARMGARVVLIGRLGDDAFGGVLRQNLAAEGVDTSYVWETRGCASGVALICVDQTGANAIAVVPGANGQLSESDLVACSATIAGAKALIVQLETPLATVAAAIRIAQQHGVLTVLDPAPAPQSRLPRELLGVAILSPNQSEAEALTGIRVDDWQSAEAAAGELQRQGAKDVVLKMGSLGALVCRGDGTTQRVLASSAEIVDTTAAGDAFTAAMTVALCEGQSLIDAARIGCIAGTLTCTRFGAQPALPTRAEVEAYATAALV